MYPTVNEDYYKPEKQQYLRYAYGAQGNGLGATKILDTLQEHYLEASLPSFYGMELSYRDPKNPNRRTDLYYTNPADTFAGYTVLNQILGMAKAEFGSGHIFLPTWNNSLTASTAPAGHSLNLYRCSDGLYWYRYFGNRKKIYNVYLRVPAWVYQSMHPGMTIAGIRFGNGDTGTRRFTLLIKPSGSSDTLEASGSTDFDIAWSSKLTDVLLGNENPNKPDAESGELPAGPNCEQERLYNAIYAGQQKYTNYLDSAKRSLRAAFYAHVMSQIGEKFWVDYIDRRFAYTLYNYDLAGNLITTVPPEGVHPISGSPLANVNWLRQANSVNPNAIPQHTKVTHYEFNSANQPVREITPDAGQKTMSYDAKGNVILAQTQRQKDSGLFTYMLYDGQNRLTETGQVKWNDCPKFVDQPLYVLSGSTWVKTAPPNACACENLTDSVWTYCVPNTTLSYDNAQFAAKIRRMPRTQVVATVYDSVLLNLATIQGMSAQENLRSRVAANMYFETVPASSTGAAPRINYNHATHYSYDVAGNVKTLVQEFPDLNATKQRFKRVDYEYDLISGKVNALAYNRGFSDQFYHRYKYDADNRIAEAQTSRDGFIWKRDAGYTYYQHGPLARVSLGEQRVQGVDYAYTIQGWIKTINGDRTDTLRDLGRDGRSNVVTPKDVYATTIDYFPNDYQTIGTTPVSYLATTAKGLYNGNIARQTTDVSPFVPLTALYTYDQMNRIRKADYAKDSAGVLQFNNWYASAYKYDLDGNLKMLTRKEGTGVTMDSLIYQYPNATANNRLGNVLDYASYSPAPNLDLPQYTNASATRFTYDADGSLTSDLTSNTTGIKWNIYGKMSDLITSNSIPYHFGYDATGTREFKRSSTIQGNHRFENGTYYVRDAQGNILAEYEAASVFNTQSKVTTCGGVRTSIGGVYPTRTWLSALDTFGYLQQAPVIDYFSNLGGGNLNYPAGYYLAYNPSVWNQFVSNASDFPLAMARYSSVNGLYPLADVLLHGMAVGWTPSLGVPAMMDQLSYTFFGNPDANLRGHALEQLARTVPSIYSEILSSNRITLTTMQDSLDAAAAMDGIATSPSGYQYYRDRLISLYGTQPALIKTWLQQATADTQYVLSDWALLSGYTAKVQSALTTYGDNPAQAQASSSGVAKSLLGVYSAASWWGGSLPVVQSIYPGGPGAMATLGYTTDPVRYIESLLGDHDPAIIDSALGTLDDGIVDIVTLTSHVGVTLTGAQATTFSNNPYLEDQRVSLASHHMYGSSRLGIAQYASGQSQYRWDYLHGVIDTFGVMRPRPWYSYTLNSLYRTGETDVYGIGLDSSAGATALIGLKQYELVNHLQNVQVTISDKKYNKDANGDGQRDAYKAIPVMVYDYYPFGQLMPGRSLDTAGLCVTSTQYTEVPVYHWMNGGALDPGLGGGVSAYNGATISGLPNGGVTASGNGGGFTYMMSGITVPYVTVQLNFSYLSGAATIKVYQGTNVGPTGTQLYSASVGYISPAASLPIYTGGSLSSPAAVTVVVDMPGGLPTSPLFSIDSIGYKWITYSAPIVTLVTRCGDPRDKYEFGLNGQMKMNEIAGIGNHNTALFWEYDPRLGRRWNLDPVNQIRISSYAVFKNCPISLADPLGDEVKNGDNIGMQNAEFDLKRAKDKLDKYKKDNKIQDDGTLTKKDFLAAGGTKEQWKEYKRQEDNVKELQRKYESFKQQAPKTERNIELWKLHSPNLFKKINELPIDMLLSTVPNLRETIGNSGQTLYVPVENAADFVSKVFGTTIYGALTVQIDERTTFDRPQSYDMYSDLEYTLNHEAGHFYYYVTHPAQYFRYYQKLIQEHKDQMGGHRSDDLGGKQADEYGREKDIK